MRLTALLVDDEALARRLLREFLKPHADIEVVGECADGEAALQALETLAPDLVFLDIQMPRLSGLELLRLSGREHGVIFTTAHEAHALQAFELHAVDYLLKPFSQARFDRALAQARKLLPLATPGLRQLVAASSPQRIVVRERQQVHVIKPDELLCAEAQDDYVCIHLAERSLLKTQTLAEFEAGLDPKRFVRVHRSWLINLDQLLQIERQGKDQLVALLRGGRRVPVSRAGYERIRPLLK
ncbi:LytR/AlgR family response regulator transcription factor [Paucibacter soli]|uniref:LytR/AlgR family response regulator transcription factor n=1 Tax=Paucibacter soli TaxID=3133433 RepID=UPI0030A35435